jgi:hypothetical protein
MIFFSSDEDTYIKITKSSWPPKNIDECIDFQNFTTRSFSYEKHDCYTEIALKELNISICDNIKTLKFFEICKVMVDNEINVLPNCLKIEDRWSRDACLGAISGNIEQSKRVGEEACDAITCNLDDDGAEYPCRDNCYWNVARNTRNNEICSRIISEDMIQSCIEIVEKTKSRGY